MPVAEIVGGGIAGFVTSILLARRGWSVRVHERSHQLRASGNGITIFENGLRVLEALDLAPDVVAYGQNMKRWDILRHTAELIVSHDPVAATGGRVVMFQRQALIDLLAKAARSAGVEIALGSQVVGADTQGVVTIQDGSQLKADLVVGADGIFSPVRRSIVGDLPLGNHRKGAIRTLIPIEAEEFPEGDLSIGREYNHPSGRRVGLLPCSSTVCYLILVSLRTDEAAHTTPIEPELWTSSFPSLSRFFKRVGALGHYDPYFSVSVPKWHYGRCALVGDAAHGMTPALGQGAGCAMMTAYALGSADFDNKALGDALEDWETGIRPLISFTQKFAEDMTEGRLDPNNEVFFADPKLRPVLEADIPARFRQEPAFL